MSISIRVNWKEGNSSAAFNENSKVNKNGNQKSIFAGNLMAKDTDGLVDQKRNFAKKQAMKLISDAWDRDGKTAQNVQDMKSEHTQKIAELIDFKSKLKDIEKDKEAFREEYGVDPDSQEQKDLELLEKYQNNMNGSSFDSFSKEEIERLKELQYTERTEYQNKVLELNAEAGAVNLEIRQGEYQVIALKESIFDTRIEQLKSQDMLNAENAADEIMDAANDEILGLLIQEGIDHMDQKREEEQEKAEEAAEKQEEQEEKLQEAKEKREEQEELIKEAQDAEQLERDAALQKQSAVYVVEAQKNIQRILKENNLINEDLKGIEIDFNF